MDFKIISKDGFSEMRKKYTIPIYPAIYSAFKLLCDRAGYKRLNQAVELLMLKCIKEGSLGLPPAPSGRIERLETRIKLIQECDRIRETLGWKRE